MRCRTVIWTYIDIFQLKGKYEQNLRLSVFPGLFIYLECCHVLVTVLLILEKEMQTVYYQKMYKSLVPLPLLCPYSSIAPRAVRLIEFEMIS